MTRTQAIEAALREMVDARDSLRSWHFTEPCKATKAETDKETTARYERVEVAENAARAALAGDAKREGPTS